METVVGLFNEMKLLKIRCHWSYNDIGVNLNGTVQDLGRARYWMGIDEAIEFWENGKRNRANRVGSGREFIQQLHTNHRAILVP